MLDISKKENVNVSVLITTYNEELNIEDCLRSLIPWAGEIIILDSGSTDKTIDYAKKYTDKIFTRKAYIGAADQRNWALDNLSFLHQWILLLDADERVPLDLAGEIGQVVDLNGDEKVAYWINRRFIFYGKWIRHCGWYPSWNVRLFKLGKARHEMRAVGPHLIVDGKSGWLNHDLIHEDSRDISFWIEKHNRYSTWEALDHIKRLQGKRSAGFIPSGPLHTRIKRFVKDTIWARMPGRFLILFFYLYVLRLGFLDGWHGLKFSIMHSIFEYFNEIKQWEIENYKEGSLPGGINAPKYFDPMTSYR